MTVHVVGPGISADSLGGISRRTVLARLAGLVVVVALTWSLVGWHPLSQVVSAPRVPPQVVRSVAGTLEWAGVPAFARLSISPALGAEEPGLTSARTPRGVLARASGGLSSRFSLAGALVSTGATAVVDLRLSAIGRGGSVSAVGRTGPARWGDRVNYAHDDVSEWYADGPIGLEQGFTVARRMAGDGALTLAVGTVAAGVRARLLPGGRSLALSDASGPLAQYGGLSVTDAAGRHLGAWIVLQGRRVQLRIDDAGARYPLRVDPFVHLAKLTATGARALGTSVAVSANGKVLAVGADNQVYVFVRPAGGSWQNARQTVALGGVHLPGNLGISVAISANGSTIVAGDGYQQPLMANEIPGRGAAYVYTEPNQGWKHASGHPKAELTNSDSVAGSLGGDGLGSAVAINAAGDLIAAGAPGWNNEQGALYLYTKPARGWRNHSSGRVAAGSGSFDAFGAAVAMSAGGNTIVVGAPVENSSRGAIYVITQARHSPSLRALPDPASGTIDPVAVCSFDPPAPEGGGALNPVLGQSVAISADGKTIVAGEPCGGNGGVVEVFSEPSRGWVRGADQQTALLTPLPPAARDIRLFGSSVAISGDGKTISATDPAYVGTGGFVAVFSRPSGGWRHFSPSVPRNFATLIDPTGLDSAGTLGADTGDPLAVSFAGTGIFVGANGHQNSDGSVDGAVDVYTLARPPTFVSCSPATVKLGQTSKCTSTVRASLSSFVAPTGTVSLRSTGGPAAQLSPTKCKLKAVPTAPGTASCSVKFTPLQPLVYSITARYGGDSKYPSGTGTTVVSTPRTPTSTHVSCSPAALAVTATTHCTATVGGVSGHPPSLVPKANGGSVGPAACSAGGGTETCTFSFSSGAPGTHTVSAHYPGDANDAPSSGSTTVAFAGPTMTSVTCSPARISTTQTSTCYATVTQITGPATPPAVNFSTQGGGTTYGPEKCTISSSRTVELCTAGLTSVGTGYYEAVATFPGDADAAISTGYAPLLVVNPDAIVVSCTMANVCTAVVTDTSAIPNLPTGTVTWTANPTPPKTMFSGGGQCTLTQFGSSASVALCSVDFTAPPGSYLITGHYTGDQGHDPISGQTTAH